MKRDVARYILKCAVFQQVKIEHQRPGGLLQSLPIPERKWDHITMDFVSGFPRTAQGHNAVWVIIDRLTKSAHFLDMKTTDTTETRAQLYIREIVRLHRVSLSIVSDRDSRFVARFWQSLQQAMGTELRFSTAFHPQTDGQSERVIQVVEDMLRACVLDFKGNWSNHLSCDAPKPGGPLTTRQPAEYKWMSGYPTPLQKIGQSLLCSGSSTQIQYLYKT